MAERGSPGRDPDGISPGAKKGRALFFLMTAAAAAAVFGLCLLYGRWERDAAFAERRAALLEDYGKRIAALRGGSETGDGADYPFVQPSSPHEYTVKHLPAAETGYVYEGSAAAPRAGDPDADAGDPAAGIAAAAAAGIEAEAPAPAPEPDDGRVTVVKKDLREIFNDAVSSTNTADLNFSIPDTSGARGRDLRDAADIDLLPEDIKRDIPPFVYSSHNYSTDPAKRSVTLNGAVVKEGGRYQNLEVLRINENHVIMRVGGQSFSVGAMEDYRP